MPHAAYAQAAFGSAWTAPAPPPVHALPAPGPGEIVCVTGPSGAGKTLALKALGGRELPALSDAPVLDLFAPGLASEFVLRTLARTGLADGRLWRLGTPQLSAGEQQRLRLALALCNLAPGELLVADEFDAHLDPLTACALAQVLRRLADGGLRMAVSTHNPATLPHMAPDRLLQIDGDVRALAPPAREDLGDEVVITPGRLADWRHFRHWHYLGAGNPGPVCAVYVAALRGRRAGIAIYGYPHRLLSARRHALPVLLHPPQPDTAALNRDLRLLQRVVVDPRLRGVGIARRLLEHGCRALGVPYIECVARMGAFTGFLTAAGFARVCELELPRAIASLLRFCERREIDSTRLIQPAYREYLRQRLPAADCAALARHLRAVAQSRANTGHGASRGHEPPQAVLESALARLHARPAYFLWQAMAP
ncbi:MAG: hypothetical protein KF696_07805 [Planctomycetes bacterium]|nr:hypothetical protein [Planctomycetota bacterium]MCW8135457.1 hypothetical protein [Planctomycetota bacterium]